MAWWKRVLLWFTAGDGARSDPPTPQRPAAPVPQAAATPTPGPVPRVADSSPWLHRDELLDDTGRLAGYRFVTRTEAVLEEGPQGLAQVLVDAGVPAFAERRMAVVDLPQPDWAQAEALVALATPRWVWRVDVSRLLGEAADWMPALRTLRASGQGVALAGLGPDPLQHPALGEATHVVLPFAPDSADALERQLKALQRDWPDVKVMVDEVPSWPDRHWCRAMGARWVSGPFVCTLDPSEQGKPLHASRLVLLNMLNLVRQEADAAAIADVAKRDPGLAAQLLLQANAAQHGLRTPITALEQAILMMGRQALYRWLAVAVFRSGSDRPLDRTLLEMALSRGRFMEVVAQSQGHGNLADELFLLGVLSLVDVLLGLPMPELVKRISLSPPVQQALVETDGPLAPFLMLTIAMEKGLERRVGQLALQLQLEAATLPTLRTEALAWAEEAVR